MGKYNYETSFEEAVKQGIPKEEYARESSKNVILTWIANELAEANRLKGIEIRVQLMTRESQAKGMKEILTTLEDQA